MALSIGGGGCARCGAAIAGSSGRWIRERPELEGAVRPTEPLCQRYFLHPPEGPTAGRSPGAPRTEGTAQPPTSSPPSTAGRTLRPAPPRRPPAPSSPCRRLQ